MDKKILNEIDAALANLGSNQLTILKSMEVMIARQNFMEKLILDVQSKNICEVETLRCEISDIKSDLQQMQNQIIEMDETIAVCLSDN